MKKMIVTVCVVWLFAATAFGQQADKPPYYLSAEALDASLGVDADAEKPANFVRAVYFHRVPGCATCQKMSKYIFETVKTQFPADVKDKKLVLRYMNFEDAKNAKVVKAFDIKSPTLVIIDVRDGKDTRVKKAARLWELSADKAKFQTYVAEELKAYLAPENKEK